MNADEYALGLKRRLPEGDAWPTAEETDGTTAWDLLLNALSQEPARVDEDAVGLINKVIPDNEDTDLDAWEVELGLPDEDLTDPERLARIRAFLRARGEVDLVTLQDVARKLAGDDTGVKLFNRAYPPTAPAAGSGCDYQPFLWLCELYPDLNTQVHDSSADLAEWTGFSGTSVTGSFSASPVTFEFCPQVNFAALTPVERELAGVPDDATVSLSFWIYFHTAQTLTIEIFDRANASAFGEVRSYTPDVWNRVALTFEAGAGAFDPKLTLTTVASEVADLSWFCAGVTDSALEAKISAVMPMHTRGRFAIQGEYETLLANGGEGI